VTTLHGLATAALRRLDAEDAHGLAVTGLKLGLGPRGAPDDPILATRLAGVALPNPIGLAAGFDKNAEVFAPMLRAGFGFVECGTVTPLAQPGNPRPRLFRLSEDQAVINRLGFNNRGLEAYAGRLAGRQGGGVVGGNLGANKESEDRIGDYATGLKRLWGLADYFTVNISSPNTPGLRALQTKTALEELLGRVAEARAALPGAPGAPVFLKVAPDLDDPEVVMITEAVTRFGLQGIIVGNTTLSRPGGLRSPLRGEPGGLSGRPLEDLATRMVRLFRIALDPALVVIGCGGISSGAGAFAKIRAGAAAVQLYSGLVFAGPQLVDVIKRDLADLLRANGFTSVEDAVGVA
jgi:dihydroorotate dehydrogenase